MAVLKGIKIEGAEELHQLDWDSAVANRPFGTTEGLQEIVPQQDAVFTYAEGDGYTAEFMLDFAVNTAERKAVIVNLDGTEYTTVTVANSGAYVFGNISGTGEPFMGMLTSVQDMTVVIVMTDEEPEDTENPADITHNISIMLDTKIVKKIGGEYVGTDWETTDMTSAGYIKNKPFGTLYSGDFVLPIKEYECEAVSTTEGSDTAEYYAFVSLNELPFGMDNELAVGQQFSLVENLAETDTAIYENYSLSFTTAGVEMSAANGGITWKITEKEYNSFNEGGRVTKKIGVVYAPEDSADLDIPIPSRYLPGLTIVDVYTNDSPTSSFGSKTLTFDDSYSMYAMVTNASTSNTENTEVTYAWAGCSGTVRHKQRSISAVDSGYTFTEEAFERTFTASANKISFGFGNAFDYSTNAATIISSTSVIPIKIYGIK